jgi:hypothetical protein
MTGQRFWARWILVAALFGGFSMVAFAGAARAETVVWKRCGKCNRNVPITSQVGQSCPYCGAYWGSAQSQYVPGGGASGGSSQGDGPAMSFPRPRNSLERMAFYQAIVQQQRIQQQMLWQQMVQQERELRRQVRTEWAQKLREEEKARRDALYQRHREASERAREHDNP